MSIRHPILHRTRFACVLVIIFATEVITQAGGNDATRYSRELPATHPQADKLRAKIEGVIFPRIEFRDTTMQEAIKYLQQHRPVATVLASRWSWQWVPIRHRFR